MIVEEIVVVEGKDDTTALRRAFPGIETIETGGSAINTEILERIRLAQQRRGVIVLTDPDHAGERIRSLIQQHVPACKHAFIAKEHALGKRGVGVEHASPEILREALRQLKTPVEAVEKSGAISWADLMDAGLISHPQAAFRREQVGKLLGIGYANGKQFYKRCSMFRITGEEFACAVAALEGQDGG